MDQNIFSSNRIQVIAIITSAALLILILSLIRKKRIKEEFSLLWLFFGVIFLMFSIWRHGLEYIADLLGISYTPAALFIIMLLAIFLILIEFSTIISRLSTSNKNLAQEVGILKLELETLKTKAAEDKYDEK